jgi:hypothetical protein
MAKMDAKTIGAAVLVAVVGINYSSRAPVATQTARSAIQRGADTPETETPVEIDAGDEVYKEIKPFLDRPNHEHRFLIATVSDPDSTTLRLYTDRTLEALILAAFENGYVLVHHWIPWRHSLESLDAQYEQRKRQLNEFKERGKYPGVMVFEKAEQMMFLFLVPEHPSAGVKRDVLMRAARYVAAGGKPAKGDEPCHDSEHRAPLIHTTFTGSLESLDEWMASDPCASCVVTRVVSGAVLGLSVERRDPWKGVLVTVPYRWVRVQLQELRGSTEDYLKLTRGAAHSGIANLTEDSTGFGKSVKTETDLTFPWQIYRVRNAMPDGAESSGIFGLPLNLRDPRKPHGALPTFAPEQTPAVEEVVLAQITARMERLPTNYVFLTATDPLDLVFLSRLLRKANPGQRVIVNSPDMMLLRAHDLSPATGTLVPATFPISNHLLLDKDPRKVFDSEFTASIFMASSDAISDPHRTGRGPLRERSAWLMTLGRNGYWPVALLKEGDNRTAANDRLPLSATAGFSTLLAASFGWLLLLVWARFRGGSPSADFRAKLNWPGWRLRALSLGRVTAAFAVLVAVCAMPLWFPRRQDAGWIWPSMFWLAMFSLTGAGFAPWFRRRTGLRRRARLVALALGPLLGVLLSLALFAIVRPSDPHDILRFFLLRSQDYLNGVAPLLPVVLLLAGFVGCAWASHLANIAATERFVYMGAPGEPPELGRVRVNWRLFGPAAAVSLLVFAAIWRPLHSIETELFDTVYLAIAAGLLSVTLYACFDMVTRWGHLKLYLERLEIHPFRFALTAMPWSRDAEPVWESNPRRRSTVFYGRAHECLRRLEFFGGGDGEIQAARKAIERYLDARQHGGAIHRRAVERSLQKLAVHLTAVLSRADGPWSKGAADLVAADTDSPQDLLRQEFLGIRLAAFLRSHFLILRVRLTTMIAGFVALTLSLNSYCFGPERIIQTFSALLLLALGGAVVTVFRQLHNDPLLARMSGAKAGEFDWGFWGKIASAAALPVLSLLASYTPALGGFLGAWLQPALEAVAR